MKKKWLQENLTKCEHCEGRQSAPNNKNKFMADENLTPIRTDALGVLLGVTASRIGDYPMTEQIKIYQALGDALPEGQQKLRARELARVLSRAEALQLEFRQSMNG